MLLNIFKLLLILAIAIPVIKLFTTYLPTMLICVSVVSLAYYLFYKHYNKLIIRDKAIKHISIASIIMIVISITIIEQLKPPTAVTSTIQNQQSIPIETKKIESLVGKTMYINDVGFMTDSVETLSIAYNYSQSDDIVGLMSLKRQGKIFFFQERTPIRIATQNKNIIYAVVESGEHDLKTGYTFSEWLKN